MAFDANDSTSIPENDGSINISQNLGDGVKGVILAVIDPVKTTGENDSRQAYEDSNLVVMIEVTGVAGSPTIRKPKDQGPSPVKVGDKGLLWFRYQRSTAGGEPEKYLAPFTSALAKILRENGLTAPRVGDTLTIVHNKFGDKDPKYPMRQPAKLADCKYEKASGGGFSSADGGGQTITADDL